MAKINLLPWRAERRERRKREFFTHLGVAAVAAIGLIVLWWLWMGVRIDTQKNRNEYLKGQITQLDAKITEIANLQKVKDHLLARKRIVEKLQSSRSQMVHLFDQVVQSIPAGARLTSLKQQGDKLTLDGVAQSNATVAEYMRNIEASPWMGPAQLVKTENVHSDSNTPYEFELVVTLGTPKADDNGASPASGSSVAAPASVATLPAQTKVAAAKAASSAVSLSAPAPVASAHAAPVSVAAPASAPSASKQADPKALHTPAASVGKGGARP